jgi:hypothetical protein
MARSSSKLTGITPHGRRVRVLMLISFVLLMAAEVEVQAGPFDKAEEYVNMVRNRAANPAGWVHKYKDDSKPTTGFSDVPAANYKISPYPAGNFAGGDS